MRLELGPDDLKDEFKKKRNKVKPDTVTFGMLNEKAQEAVWAVGSAKFFARSGDELKCKTIHPPVAGE